MPSTRGEVAPLAPQSPERVISKNLHMLMLSIRLLTCNAKPAAKTQIRAVGKLTPDLFGTVQ